MAKDAKKKERVWTDDVALIGVSILYKGKEYKCSQAVTTLEMRQTVLPLKRLLGINIDIAKDQLLAHIDNVDFLKETE